MSESTQAPSTDASELQRHFSNAYFSLRLGLMLLAAVFPVWLLLWGWFHRVEMQPSMSAYFWAADPAQCASFPLRTIFVGILVAIAAALYAYKGFGKTENRLLNAAAVFALGVAVFPENLETKQIPPQIVKLYESCPAIKEWAFSLDPSAFPLHYVCAVAMFVCLFFVALKCACKSLDFLPKDAPISRSAYKKIYKTIAWSMVGFGVVVYLLKGVIPNWVFVLEAGEIWIFAVYWFVKTRELSRSALEKAPREAARNLSGPEVRDVHGQDVPATTAASA